METLPTCLFLNLFAVWLFGVNVHFICKSYLQCTLGVFLETYGTMCSAVNISDIKINNQGTISREPYVHCSSKNHIYRMGPVFIDDI